MVFVALLVTRSRNVPRGRVSGRFPEHDIVFAGHAGPGNLNTARRMGHAGYEWLDIGGDRLHDIQYVVPGAPAGVVAVRPKLSLAAR